MDRWTPRTMLRADRAAPGHHQPHGADPVPPPAGAARRRCGRATTCRSLRCDDPRRRAVPARGQAADDRLVGAGRSTSTTRPPRAAARSSPREEWLSKPGSVGTALAGLGDPHPRRRRRRACRAGADRAPSTCGWAPPTSSNKDDGEDRREPRATGFFTVGDIGYLDEDGYLFLCDRKSDMIISGGVNIYPAEIEGELFCHPAVADVAVFGIPHDDWGEEIKAVVAAGRRASSPADELTARDPGLPARAAGQVTSCRGPSTSSPNCPATPTASSTSAGCATRTGPGATALLAKSQL